MAIWLKLLLKLVRRKVVTFLKIMGVDGDSRQDDPTDAKKEREMEASDVPVDRMKNMARNMFRKEFTSVARRIEQAVVKDLHTRVLSSTLEWT